MHRFARALSALIVIALTSACGSSNDGKTSTPGLIAPPTRTPAPPTAVPTAEDLVAAPAAPQMIAVETTLGFGNAWNVRWTADGAGLYVDGSQGAWLYADATAADPPQPVATPWAEPPVALSRDGRFAAARDAENVLQMWDVESGAALFPLETADRLVWRVVFNAEGTQAAALVSPPDNSGVEYLTTSFSGARTPDDAAITAWDLPSGAETEYAVIDDRLLDMAFDADGRLLVAGSDNNLPSYQWAAGYTQPLEIPAESSDPTLRVWDVQTGDLIVALEDLEFPLSEIDFSPDAARFSGSATIQTSQYGFTDWKLYAWETAGGALILDEQVDPTGPLEVRAFSPDGAALAAVIGARVQDQTTTYYTSNTRDEVWRFDLATGADVAPHLTDDLLLTQYGGVLGQIVYSPDGSRLAGLTRSGVIVVWDLAAPDAAGVAHTDFMGRVESVAVSTDGDAIYSGGDDGALRVWPVGAGSGAARLAGKSIYNLARLIPLPGDRLVAAEGYGGARARLWNLADGATLTQYSQSRGLPYIGISDDGVLMASSTGGGTVNLWDVETGGIEDVILASQQVVSLAFSRDNRVLATGGVDGAILVWDLTSGEEIGVLRGHSGGATHLFAAPDGALFSASLTPITFAEDRTGAVSTAAEPDYTVRRWDDWTSGAATSEVLTTITPLGDPDAFDAAQPGEPWPPPPVDATIAWTTDGAWLALIDYSTEPPTLRVWDVFGGVAALDLPLEGARVAALAFGPAGGDDLLLVGGRDDGTLSVWRLTVVPPEG